MKRSRLLFILIIVIAFIVGYLFRGGPARKPGIRGRDSGEEAEQSTLWTCAMHPHIKLPKPGKCPICAMDLIPVRAGGARGMEREPTLTMSEEAKKLAEIQTSPVERKFVTAEIRMVGKVEYDETLLAYITAWIPGRLDRLFVDYTDYAVDCQCGRNYG